MTLLLSNDDGVLAPGLRVLADALVQAGYDIRVAAPDRDLSGASNSLTLDRPLHPVTHENGFVGVNGTPLAIRVIPNNYSLITPVLTIYFKNLFLITKPPRERRSPLYVPHNLVFLWWWL